MFFLAQKTIVSRKHLIDVSCSIRAGHAPNFVLTKTYYFYPGLGITINFFADPYPATGTFYCGSGSSLNKFVKITIGRLFWSSNRKNIGQK